MNKTYVSLDLETTGLSPDTDEIIEIGAVKFQGDRVIETYNSLVNPGRTIPYRIELLCGIKQSELNAAPIFLDIDDSLRSFIEGCSIVGHNISFDLGFLSKKGVNPTGATYDTWELSTILLFQQQDYSLASLTKQLGLATPQHRALQDAIAAKELFNFLLDHALKLDISTLEKLVHLAEKADWNLVYFFREILQLKARTAFSDRPHVVSKTTDNRIGILGEEKKKVLASNGERTSLDIESIRKILEPDGILAGALDGYEHRTGQIQMACEVAKALNDSEHLIVEAGTGTGKSIAYLLPSILFSLENGIPVVVSTNTINLQEQLIHKDIPDLQNALVRSQYAEIKNLKAVQLKGRNNYLCIRKYESMRASYRLTLDEVKLLARITVWLQGTETGDRGELNLAGNELSIWNRLCAQFADRMEGQCPHHQRNTCFLYRARCAAEDAHLIVVNHALLLSDMFADTKILPDYNHLIIDEAHHLEDEATNQISDQITQWDLLNYLSRFKQEVEGQQKAGLIGWLDDCLRSGKVPVSRQKQLKGIVGSLSSHVDRAQLRIDQFIKSVRKFIESHAAHQGGYDRTLLLTQSKRVQPGWSKVEISGEDMNIALKDIADDLDGLYIGLEDLEDNRIADYDYLMLELAYLFGWTNELCNQIDALVSHPEEDSIYWLVIYGQNDGVGLHTAPLSVSEVLERTLFSSKDCVVLTGATLSIEGTFEYIKGRLGLEYANELLLGAPFDYESSTMIYLPKDIPEPGSSGFQQEFERALIELCLVSRGRALVLFTSHASLRATLAAIQAPLENEGILVLGQGVDGSPKQLKAVFKDNPHTVLLGTASFWEGVDIAGEALSVLAIVKLPFSVPTEPIFASRSTLFDDPFNQYTIPLAAIRFKQGFGRLIRSRNDRGVLVIFDKRLQTKRYGSAFLKSIPQCTVVTGPCKEAPSKAAKWLGWDS